MRKVVRKSKGSLKDINLKKYQKVGEVKTPTYIDDRGLTPSDPSNRPINSNYRPDLPSNITMGDTNNIRNTRIIPNPLNPINRRNWIDKATNINGTLEYYNKIK